MRSGETLIVKGQYNKTANPLRISYCQGAAGAQGCGRIGGKGIAGPGEGSGAAKPQDVVRSTTVRRLRRRRLKRRR